MLYDAKGYEIPKRPLKELIWPEGFDDEPNWFEKDKRENWLSRLIDKIISVLGIE